MCNFKQFSKLTTQGCKKRTWAVRLASQFDRGEEFNKKHAKSKHRLLFVSKIRQWKISLHSLVNANHQITLSSWPIFSPSLKCKIKSQKMYMAGILNHFCIRNNFFYLQLACIIFKSRKNTFDTHGMIGGIPILRTPVLFSKLDKDRVSSSVIGDKKSFSEDKERSIRLHKEMAKVGKYMPAKRLFLFPIESNIFVSFDGYWQSIFCRSKIRRSKIRRSKLDVRECQLLTLNNWIVNWSLKDAFKHIYVVVR